MRMLSCVVFACALLRGADWPTVGGSPQRDGWAKSETAFTKENVKGLELLYKYKADSGGLTTPMVNGRLITYLGFKEMLVFGGAQDNVYSVDADLNRLIWKAHLQSHGANTCGGLTAPVAMPGSSTAIVARGVRPPIAAAAAAPPVRRPNRGGEFYAVSSDGYLHVLNTSTGEDRSAPLKFLPANAKVSALNVSDNVIYAATLDNCGGNPDAVYAMDLTSDGKKILEQSAQEGSIAGTAGTAIGSDGVVYVQAQNVHGGHNDIVAALAPRTLKIQDYFLVNNNVAGHAEGITPVAFSWNGREIIAAAGADGQLYLLDSKSLRKPLFEGGAVMTGGFHGTFASWEDAAAKDRWLYASFENGVTAFKVQDNNGKPTLVREWSSQPLVSPSSPVVANGVVFVSVKTGLIAMDSLTGALLYSSGEAVSASARGGLAIANRRIYFTAEDDSVYCFGFSAEQPQLTGR